MTSPFILLVSGSRNSGKTRTCLEIFKYFSKRGFSVGGVITEKIGKFKSIDERRLVIDILTKKKVTLAKRGIDGKYEFVPAGVVFANKVIREFSGDILIVDEIGVLERKGRGFQAIFKKLKIDPPEVIVISCRDVNVGWLKERLGVNTQVIEVKRPLDFRRAIELIEKAVS